ncbi:MAG: ferritin-like domain-containing protein [Anaerolineae bacterium]|nr:ferritin-like domain-containing protein [Anaerolineae bacterium]
MEMKNLQDLFVDVLKDTYDAEHQITKALPKMAKAAKSKRLTAAFEQHLKQTEDHIKRLEMVFESLDRKPTRKSCKGMKGLIEEGDEVMKEDGDADVLDAGLIAAAQKVEHYEIAAYGTLIAYANLLGLDTAAKTLQETLDEEKTTDQNLTELAENTVNVRAA